MRLERRSIDCGDHGRVPAVLAIPDRRERGHEVAVFLAPGAGSDMTNPLLSGMHEGLAERGFLSVKFNFPYRERGARVPDPAPVLELCYRAVIDAICESPEFAPRALIIGGKSLGGRMASHLAARGALQHRPLAGVLLLGYPLHPAGRPNKLRVAHLEKIGVPMLFFAGTRDALASLDLLRSTLGHLPRARLHVIDGGDHSFNLPKRLGRSPQSVLAELLDSSAQWIRTVTRGAIQEVCDGR
jgi:predicted alpha/beta-hydrolase family hydrolase